MLDTDYNCFEIRFGGNNDDTESKNACSFKIDHIQISEKILEIQIDGRYNVIIISGKDMCNHRGCKT